MGSRMQMMEQATCAFVQRRYADAHGMYLKALEYFGPDSDLCCGLGQVEFALSIVSPDAEDVHGYNAVRWIRQAIQLSPEHPEYYCLLGGMLEHIGAPDYEAAAHAYRDAIRLEPVYTPALAALAMLYGVPEDVVPLDEAISCCEKAVQVAPTKSRWLTLARLYGDAHREADAQRATVNSLLEHNEAIAPPY